MQADPQAPVMLWTARPDLSCEWVSASWLEFTGCTREQALGVGCEAGGEPGWTRAVHPEDLARWLDTFVRAFDAREPFEIEYRLRRRDGEYRWVFERARPRVAPGGLLVGYSGACMDVDERRREHDALARSLERERRARIVADEARGTRQAFIASVLQELEPATRAMGAWAAHLCTLLPPGSEAARAAGAIAENARGQEQLMSSLLSLSGRPAPRPADEALLFGVRVLVVEHDQEARDTMIRVLSVAGAETRAAASAPEALQALGAWRPDVLLSDLQLEGEDGYALVRALRSMPAERGGCVRAAALTSDDAPADSAVAAGYDAELAKPVEPVALLATVARLAQPASV